MSLEVYVSTDVEADGPIPGRHSMLSFGSFAFTVDVKTGEIKELGRFERNLHQLAEAKPDERTMSEFWAKEPEAWAACRQNLVTPEEAMKDYVAWLKALPSKPVFVGYPAGFDWTFVYWYLIAFAGESPFGFQALDAKSYASAILKRNFRKTVKSSMPDSWFKDAKEHTHVAIDDAVEQGYMFARMLISNVRREDQKPQDAV